MLVIALMLVTVLATLGLSTALSSMTEGKIANSYSAGTAAFYAADAAIERTAGDLVGVGDWSLVLNGTIAGSVDGPAGVRTLPDGTTVDLRAIAVDEPGPWGANNARWQLYSAGPLSTLLPAAADAPPAYVVVWAGDDPAEVDGDPLVDSNGTILLVAHAYGLAGTRRAIEAAITRAFASNEPDRPIGVRLLTWREQD